jgi:hypothetical protein
MIHKDINRSVFTEYNKEVEKVAEIIAHDLPEEGTLDGREWCKKYNIPETVFADAIKEVDNADWGVSPMCPWKSKYLE